MVNLLFCCKPIDSINDEKTRASQRHKRLHQNGRSSIERGSGPIIPRNSRKESVSQQEKYKSLNAISEMGELEAAAAATGIELYAGGSKTRQQKALASIKNHQPDIFADEAQVMEKLESEFESEVRISTIRTSRQMKRGNTGSILSRATTNSSTSLYKKDSESMEKSNKSFDSGENEPPRSSKALDLIFNDILSARAMKETKRTETSKSLQRGSSLASLHSSIPTGSSTTKLLSKA
ncbi:unnamed protein product [Oikopleura dioica]|uniref:Uncharacterized protein n=1 Tax=Oikopleura dioica TaxID=34765 RepID=E4YLT6_OIKDI|nr:unnamed protein product [Oikopleura dioica]